MSYRPSVVLAIVAAACGSPHGGTISYEDLVARGDQRVKGGDLGLARRAYADAERAATTPAQRAEIAGRHCLARDYEARTSCRDPICALAPPPSCPPAPAEIEKRYMHEVRIRVVAWLKPDMVPDAHRKKAVELAFAWLPPEPGDPVGDELIHALRWRIGALVSELHELHKGDPEAIARAIEELAGRIPDIPAATPLREELAGTDRVLADKRTGEVAALTAIDERIEEGELAKAWQAIDALPEPLRRSPATDAVRTRLAAKVRARADAPKTPAGIRALYLLWASRLSQEHREAASAARNAVVRLGFEISSRGSCAGAFTPLMFRYSRVGSVASLELTCEHTDNVRVTSETVQVGGAPGVPAEYLTTTECSIPDHLGNRTCTKTKSLKPGTGIPPTPSRSVPEYTAELTRTWEFRARLRPDRTRPDGPGTVLLHRASEIVAREKGESETAARAALARRPSQNFEMTGSSTERLATSIDRLESQLRDLRADEHRRALVAPSLPEDEWLHHAAALAMLLVEKTPADVQARLARHLGLDPRQLLKLVQYF